MEEENDCLFCTDCQMAYSNLSSFKKHIRKRHPTKLQQIFPSKIEQTPKFTCDTCGLGFNASRSLTCHKRSCNVDSHENKSGIKLTLKTKQPKRSIIEDDSIACSDCELEFDDIVTFKQHMRDHRDNKIVKDKKLGVTSKLEEKKRKKNDPVGIKQECTDEIGTTDQSDSPVRKSRRSRKPVSYKHLIESGSDSENETLSKYTLKGKKSGKKHICNECHMEYEDLNNLQKHIRKHHPCKLEKTEKTWKKAKFLEKKFSCEGCFTKYNNISSLRKHIRKFHPTKWSVLAPKLYKKFKNSEKTYTCPECQAIYGSVVGLRKHIRKYHAMKLKELTSGLYKKKPRNTEKTLSCDDCQIKYCTLNSLRKHIKKEHPARFNDLVPILYKKKFGSLKRDISCSECDMMYSNMSGLRKHTRKHHPNKLVELAPLLYTFKRNMAKNILMKKRNIKEIEHLIDSELIDMDKYKCNICESSYSNISNLRKHLRKFHPEKLSDVAPLIKDNTNYQYPCDLCPKKFNCIRNFKYHQRKCHPEIAQPVVRNTKPSKINKCPLCFYQHTERKKLLQHFKDEHNIEVAMNPVEVTTFEDFLKWKDSFEKETNTRFVKEYHFSCTSHDVVSYICHRSGYYYPKGKGLRHMKAQGSSKINGYCPAAMKLKKMKDNTVKATFCGTHIGHTTDVNHLHLTPKERQIIAEKIAMNIPFNEILESMKDSVSESDFKRIHMLSKKDLYNIKSSFHLSSPIAKAIKPPSENISFEVWIEDMKKNGDCILFHKPQGQVFEEHPNLKPEDFVLMIMNQTQRDKLKKFGHDTICLDRSFYLNSHQFELTSVLVLNETEEGFPCAFLVSNRSDQEIMTLFFLYIKSSVGEINCRVFMSDMVDYFYNAWVSIMSDSHISYSFYCTWQIEDAWRKKLSPIKPKEKQENVINKLKAALEEKDILSFKITLESIVTQLGTEHLIWEFSNHLMQNYLQNDNLWPDGGVYKDIKFNSHLERMHKTLTHLFLNGKNAKHFGKALGDIMRFIKDKLFDRTILINRGKINNKMKIAIFRHKLSLHTKMDSITKTDAGWQIPSSETSDVYTINEIQPMCRCEFICPECKSCVHRYLCSCLDSSVKWNMCKHIHLLCRYLNIPTSDKQQFERQDNAKKHVQHEQHPQELVYVKQPTVYDKQLQQVECVKESPQQVKFVKAPSQQVQQIEYIKPQQIEYVKQQSLQVEYVKQQPQQLEHMHVQHIQVGNHVNHVDQVESTYIYCNETNQREMDAILAEVNICNLETVQVTQVTEIPTSCTIQIPTSCTMVPQVSQITTACSGSFEEIVDTKESLKMKFLKLLEEASSPSELEIVQKMLSSLTPTLEVIKGSSNGHQVLFPL